MTARPSIAGLVVISPAAVVVLLIGLWAILGTWQDEAAARAVPRPVAPRGPLRPSEQATIDLVEKTRVSVVNITTQAKVVDRRTRSGVNIARGTGSEFTWNDRGHLVTNYDVVRVRLGRASAVERRTRCAVLAGRRQHIGRFVRRCSGMVAIQTSASRCRPDSRKSASAPLIPSPPDRIERFTTSMSGKGE